MKTVFISSFHSLISRNILSTPLISEFQKRGFQVVILTPKDKQYFFEEEFSKKGAIIEPVNTKVTGWEKFLRYLALSTLRTSSLEIKRKTELKGSGAFVSKFLSLGGVGIFLTRLLSRFFVPGWRYEGLFKKYQPVLVFVTDVQSELDVRLIKESKEQRVPVVGMVRSWDNLTAKGLVRIIPDRLLVNNETLLKEAVEIQKITPSLVEIIGIPHYDLYIHGRRSSREDFFKKIGGDPLKKLILFTHTGDRYIKNNNVDADILKILESSTESNVQVLVRFPPADTVMFLDGKLNTEKVLFDRPSTRFKTIKNTELSAEDDIHLADTLYYSDVVVTGPSTICVDAAFFNKPTILIGFDGDYTRLYYESLRRYYDYSHLKPVVASGGVRLVETERDLSRILRSYLMDPEQDQEGRDRIVKEECFSRDGKSTDRLVSSLLSFLEHFSQKQ